MTFMRFCRRAVLTATALSLVVPAFSSARELAYEANNYRVYLVEPEICSLELATADGAQIKMLNDESGEAGWQTFAYILDGFPRVKPNYTFQVVLQFDNEATPLTMVATGYEDGNQTGLTAYATPELFKRWGKGRQVTIRLGDPKKTVIETVSLTGSAEAMKHLQACTNPNYSVTVSPAPSSLSKAPLPLDPNQNTPMTALGRFSIRCDTRTSTSTYSVGTTVIGKGTDCGEGWEPFVAESKTFANKRQIILVQAGGGGMASSGSIVLIAPGAKPKIVPLDYLTEFGDIKSDTQLITINQGMVNDDAICTGVFLQTLNWNTGTTTEKLVSSEGSCD